MEAIDEYVFPTRRYNATDAQGYPTIFAPGMSMRAYFAGQAIQGLLANDEEMSGTLLEIQTHIAHTAVGYADALIAALAKGGA